MMGTAMVRYNDSFFQEDAPLFTASSRAHRFGDGFFESMKWVDGKLLFAKEHAHRIAHALRVMKMKAPESFSSDQLEEICTELSRKNNLEIARVRIQFNRNGAGVYSPESSSSSFLVEVQALESREYILNSEAISLGIYPDSQKVKCQFSNIKSSNALSSVMASIWATEHKLDDALLLNTDGNVAESSNSNVFFVKDGIFITPALSEACVEGIMRKMVIKMLNEHKLPFKEAVVSPAWIHTADEIFLTNAARGIRFAKLKEKNSDKHEWTETILNHLNGFIRKNYLEKIEIQPSNE